jgi:NAD+ kinase
MLTKTLAKTSGFGIPPNHKGGVLFVPRMFVSQNSDQPCNLHRDLMTMIMTMEEQALASAAATKGDDRIWDVATGSDGGGGVMSRLHMKPHIKTIFILTKIFDPQLVPLTRDLVKWLLSTERGEKYIAYVEDKIRSSEQFDEAGLVNELCAEYAVADKMEQLTGSRQGQPTASTRAGGNDVVASRLRSWNGEACRARTCARVLNRGRDDDKDTEGSPPRFDLVITLGGDGTVLYASWLFQKDVPPVLSFSLGTLGFLTKFDFGDFRRVLTTAFESGMTVSRRRRFEGIILRSQKKSRRPEVAAVEGAAGESARDLVDELIGNGVKDVEAVTHVEEARFEILNEIVVDRGPNPSKLFPDLPDRHSSNAAS